MQPLLESHFNFCLFIPQKKKEKKKKRACVEIEVISRQAWPTLCGSAYLQTVFDGSSRLPDANRFTRSSFFWRSYRNQQQLRTFYWVCCGKTFFPTEHDFLAFQ